MEWLVADRILTLNPELPVAQHLGIQKGRIVRLGVGAPPAGEGPVRWRFTDATVVPGLMDSHVHLANTAFASAVPVATGLRQGAQLGPALARWAREEAPGDDLLWVVGYDGEHWGEGGQGLTPEAMDEASGGRPVFMTHRTGHAGYLSASAFRLLGVPADAPGVVRRDGRPTGMLVGATYMNLVARLRASERYMGRIRPALAATAQRLRRAGLTAICSLEPDGMVEHLLAAEPALAIRLQVFWQTRDPERPAAAGLGRVGGCQATALDGDIGPHTMAITSPYADDPEALGSLYWADEELTAFAETAARRGLQVALHAIGDRAVDQLLAAYGRALTLPGVPAPHAPWRIDHIELPRPGQVVRARRLGLALAVQPAFNLLWPHTDAIAALGTYRALCFDPLASLAATGIVMGGGSDSPVTPAEPLLGLRAAMSHSNPDERLTWPQALELFTVGNARVMGEEDRLGPLRPGRLADLTVLSGDLTQPTAEALAHTEVLATLVAGEEGGEVPWDSLELARSPRERRV